MTETTQPDPQVVAWMRKHSHAKAAVWEHLAATLPTVTTEEA